MQERVGEWEAGETVTDDPLLQPFQLRHLTLRNRVFSSAHEPAYAENGMPTDRYRLYHVEKAKGGLAMTMTAGSAVVAEDSPPAFGNLHAYDDAIVPWIRRMTDEIHEHGAACMIQLTHLGRRTGWAQDDWLPVVAPSPLREPAHRAVPKEAEEWDIDRIVGKYADAAERMHAGGMDGVEIESYGHLFDQFWSPLTNRRSDEYGGSFENRLRFGWRVLTGIRRAGRCRLHRRHQDGGRRDRARRHRRRDRARDPLPAGGRRAGRFRQRHPRLHRDGAAADQRDPDPRDAVGAAPRLRRPGPRVDVARRAPRVEGRRRGDGSARDPGGQGRSGRHDPGPPRRPAHRAQDRGRAGGGDPAVRRGDVLPRPDLRVRRGPVHPQRRDQPRADDAPRDPPGRRPRGGSSWSAPARPVSRRPGWPASGATT